MKQIPFNTTDQLADIFTKALAEPSFHFVNTTDQLADIFTKALAEPSFQRILQGFGMIDASSVPS